MIYFTHCCFSFSFLLSRSDSHPVSCYKESRHAIEVNPVSILLYNLCDFINKITIYKSILFMNLGNVLWFYFSLGFPCGKKDSVSNTECILSSNFFWSRGGDQWVIFVRQGVQRPVNRNLMSLNFSPLDLFIYQIKIPIIPFLWPHSTKICNT